MPWPPCGPRVVRSTPGCAASGFRVTPWETCGAWPTACASSAATRTPAAWTSAGFDATEIGLLTELYWGLPLRTYVRTRAWSDGQLDAAEQRLVERSLLADGALTDEGRAQREAVEASTDAQCEPIVAALGDRGDELVALLTPWGDAIKAAGGYPAQGPHELAPSR